MINSLQIMLQIVTVIAKVINKLLRDCKMILKTRFIRITPCYLYPLEPNFYIVKLTGVYIIFLFLL